MRYAAAGVVVAGLLLLGGCGSESDAPPNAGQENTVSPSTQPPTPDPSTAGPSTPAPSSPGPSTSAQGPVEQAKTDLAGRLGIGVAEVRVISSEEVTWRDGSLGCPQPGMHYAQMLTNGSRIVLEAAGKQYNYHSGLRGAPFLCTNPQPPLSTAT